MQTTEGQYFTTNPGKSMPRLVYKLPAYSRHGHQVGACSHAHACRLSWTGKYLTMIAWTTLMLHAEDIYRERTQRS